MSKISDLPVLTDAHGGAYIPVVWNGQNMRIYLSTIAASVENFTPYDPAAEYNRTTPDFVSYSGNVYEYIFATPSAGNLPTNTTYWRIASAGQFNHIQNTDLGTRNNSFEIQYQSQNQDVDGDTLHIFRGGQGGGTDTAIRNHWDAVAGTRKLQYTNNYTGAGSDVWEDFDLSNVARLDGYNEFTGVFGLIYEPADVDARFFVYINGEAVERLTMNKEGKFQLSDGTTLDPLATWFRQSAGRMATDGKFNAIGGLQENSVELSDKYAGKNLTVVEYTASHTLTATDNGKLVLMNVASAHTLTMPTGLAGFQCVIKQKGAGVTTFTAGSGASVEQRESKFKTAGQRAVCTVFAESSTVWSVAGDLSA